MSLAVTWGRLKLVDSFVYLWEVILQLICGGSPCEPLPTMKQLSHALRPIWALQPQIHSHVIKL